MGEMKGEERQGRRESASRLNGLIRVNAVNDLGHHRHDHGQRVAAGAAELLAHQDTGLVQGHIAGHAPQAALLEGADGQRHPPT